MVFRKRMTSQETSYLTQLKNDQKATFFVLPYLGEEKNQIMLKALKGTNVNLSKRQIHVQNHGDDLRVR